VAAFNWILKKITYAYYNPFVLFSHSYTKQHMCELYRTNMFHVSSFPVKQKSYSYSNTKHETILRLCIVGLKASGTVLPYGVAERTARSLWTRVNLSMDLPQVYSR
jgi:hypothetical protein